jgi:hypothetical protein
VFSSSTTPTISPPSRLVRGSHHKSALREAFKDLLKGWVRAQANVCALMRFGDWCKN